MLTIKSRSDKRLIIPAVINSKPVNMLIDTGASLPILDSTLAESLSLKKYKKFDGSIMGAGGTETDNLWISSSVVQFNGCTLAQFLLSDISNIRRSIKRETGLDIAGIISLPQMQFLGMSIDANAMTVSLPK